MTLLLAMDTFKHVLKGRKVQVFNDNVATTFCAWKGSSKDLLLRLLSQELKAVAAANSIMYSVRWIASAYNPSDALTREEYFENIFKVIGIENEVIPAFDIIDKVVLKFKDLVTKAAISMP